MKDQADPDRSDDEQRLDAEGTSPEDAPDDEVLLLEEIAEPPPKRPMMRMMQNAKGKTQFGFYDDSQNWWE